VRVYTPALVVVPLAVLPGVTPALQEKVAFGVEDDPVSVAVLLVQLIVRAFAFTLASGCVVLVLTVTVAVERHPVAGSVTVKVNVPFCVTSVFALLGVLPAGEPDVGPSQLNVAPDVADEPDRVALVVIQVMVMFALATEMSGSVPFIITATLAVSEHPLLGSVTVSVYTPALVVVPLAVLPGATPLDHKYVTPGVEEEPLTVAVVLPQLTVCAPTTEMFGCTVSILTFTVVLLFVQPLAGSVTVSVYTPALVVVPLAVLPGVTPALQEKVAFGVEDDPVSVAVLFVQLIVRALAFTLASGWVVFVETVIVVLAEHPLLGSVTVRVYTPALVAVPLAVLPGVTPALQE
jgi:hypothetical protein